MRQDKILRRVYGDEYIAEVEPRLIRSLKAGFLTITGHSGVERFEEQKRALYGVAMEIQQSKRRKEQSFALPPLEALWWGTGNHLDFTIEPRESWSWKLILRMPFFVDENDRLSAVLHHIEKGHDALCLNDVKFETMREGLCVQMLHVGPYEIVHESVVTMRDFASFKDLTLYGAYHEIYIDDPRRTPPESLHTILRIPVH